MREDLTWQSYEDAQLLDLLQQHGHQWSLIAMHFDARSSNSVRNRFHRIVKNSTHEVKHEVKHNHATVVTIVPDRVDVAETHQPPPPHVLPHGHGAFPTVPSSVTQQILDNITKDVMAYRISHSVRSSWRTPNPFL